MAVWVVRHAVTGAIEDQQKTKKAATAQADEMTDAHKAVKAMHEGVPVTFTVDRIDAVEVVAVESTETDQEPT